VKKKLVQVAAPYREGTEVTIRAGGKSLYGVEFQAETTGKLIRDYARTAFYYGIRLDAKRVVLIPREDVILPSEM
jgi:hypothetical protein